MSEVLHIRAVLHGTLCGLSKRAAATLFVADEKAFRNVRGLYPERPVCLACWRQFSEDQKMIKSRD